MPEVRGQKPEENCFLNTVSQHAQSGIHVGLICFCINERTSVFKIYEEIKSWGDGDSTDDYDQDENTDIPGDIKPVNTGKKLGRNDPCPCGSGKKYKKCCMNK